MNMLASPHALLICILLVYSCVDAFTTNGIFEAQAGLPTIDRLPPSSGRCCTCFVREMFHRSSERCKIDARSSTGTCLEMKSGRGNGQAERNKSGDEPASSSSRKATQIDDGSPLGVTIVLLGGSWVVLGGGDGDGGGSDASAQMSSLPPLLASLVSSMNGLAGGGDGGESTDGRIWAVFVTASVAAGISRLARYYWNEK